MSDPRPANAERVEQYARVIVPSIGTLLGLLVAFAFLNPRDSMATLTELGKATAAVAVSSLAASALIVAAIALFYGPLTTPGRDSSPVGRRTRSLLFASFFFFAIGVVSYALLVIELIYNG